MTREDLLLLLFGALLGAGLALVIGRSIASRWRSRVATRRSRRAVAGESNAELLLRRRGYEVLESQVPNVFSVYVNGEKHEIELRADLIVARGERTFVAEVKTGDQAPSIYTANTRRQLLEYRVAFEVDGVLLVDVEEQAIAEVVFPMDLPVVPVPAHDPPAKKKEWPWERAILAFFALFLLITWLTRRG